MDYFWCNPSAQDTAFELQSSWPVDKQGEEFLACRVGNCHVQIPRGPPVDAEDQENLLRVFLPHENMDMLRVERGALRVPLRRNGASWLISLDCFPISSQSAGAC